MSTNKLITFFICTDIVGGAVIGGVYTGITHSEPLQIIFAMALGAILGFTVGGISSLTYYICLKFPPAQRSSANIDLDKMQIEPDQLGGLEPPPSVVELSTSSSLKNSLTLTGVVDSVHHISESNQSSSRQRATSC